MLQKTLYGSGKNQFQDIIYSGNEWSAPVMVNPDEIRKRIASFRLEGRTIRRLR